MTKNDELPVLPEQAVDLETARSIFDKYAELILAGWLERLTKPPTRRAESPNAWFKREAYRLISHYIEYGHTHVFSRNVAIDKRSNRLIEEAMKNPFKHGLLAMLSTDTELSRSNRHVFGNQMFYAWLHDVPPDFLNAFLAVTGGPAQIAAKLKEKTPEPGFEHRFRVDRVHSVLA